MRFRVPSLFAVLLMLLPMGALALPLGGDPAPEGPPPLAVPVVAPAAPDVAAVVAAEAPAPVAPVAALVPTPEPEMVVVPALPPAAPSVWEGLGMQALSYVVPVAGSILSILAAWLLLLLRKRFNLDLDVARDSMIRAAVRSAIAGAEEWAARALKTGKAPDGEAKLRWVIDAVSDQFPSLLSANLRRLVDEELGATPGVGATKDKAVGGGISGLLMASSVDSAL